MTQATLEQSFTAEGFEAFLDSRDEPGWLTELRRNAWADFESMPWPGRSDEEWMRTDIRLFHLKNYNLPVDAVSQSDVTSKALLSAGVDLGGHIVSQNGRTADYQLEQKWADKGVIFCPLTVAAREHSELVQQHLMTKAYDPKFDRFAALHAACFSAGAFLYVPRGVVVDQPLHAMAALDDGQVDLSHLLVVLEDGAEATLLSENQSSSEEAGGLHCGGIELIQGDRSHLRLVNLQNWGHKVWHFAQQQAVVGADANLQWTMGALGSRLSKVNQHVALAGKGAQSQVNGVMFTEGKQHLSYHTLQHHQAESTHSDFLYKAALQDKSRTVWRGMIKVDEAAQKTDGYQRNDNLLLSETARADSIPGLEILADDVRCTHGSTSGRVDEEQIFYCRSRGFTRKEAVRAIVIGFFQQIFDRISIESVRESLGTSVARKVREYE